MSRESKFERAYDPSGEWAQLFRRGDGYLGTELLRRSDDPREYLALDRWASRAAYAAFQARWSSEYRRLDHRLEELTEEEAPLGTFEALLREPDPRATTSFGPSSSTVRTDNIPQVRFCAKVGEELEVTLV